MRTNYVCTSYVYKPNKIQNHFSDLPDGAKWGASEEVSPKVKCQATQTWWWNPLQPAIVFLCFSCVWFGPEHFFWFRQAWQVMQAGIAFWHGLSISVCFFVIHMKQSMPPQGPVGFETCRFVESGAKLFVFGQKARQKHQAGGVLFCRLFQLQINGKWGRFWNRTWGDGPTLKS